MAVPGSELVIVEENDCPLYAKGDRFFLSGNATLISNNKPGEFVVTAIVRVPPQKGVCKILMGDITQVLVKYEKVDKIPGFFLSCSGCRGHIRVFCHNRKAESPGALQSRTQGAKTRGKTEEIVSLLKNFDLFKALDTDHLRDLVSLLRLEKFSAADIIIRKGDPGKNLYIIISGQVEVLDENENRISVLNIGEIFGEMSLISGEAVGATIRATFPLSVLYIKGNDFIKTLKKYPSLQMYFARLLARRLTRSNIDRSDDFSSGMIGKLSEMPPPELFQALHINQKTGTLQLSFPRGTARLCFLDGELIKAEFGKLVGKDAFYALFKQSKGRFKFIPEIDPENRRPAPLGLFMELMLEALRKIDEERGAQEAAE